MKALWNYIKRDANNAAFYAAYLFISLLVVLAVFTEEAKATEPDVDTFVGPILTVNACREDMCIRHTFLFDTPMEVCEQVATDLNTNYRGLVAYCEFQH